MKWFLFMVFTGGISEPVVTKVEVPMRTCLNMERMHRLFIEKSDINYRFAKDVFVYCYRAGGGKGDLKTGASPYEPSVK